MPEIGPAKPPPPPHCAGALQGAAGGESHSGLSDWLNSGSEALRRGGLVKRFSSHDVVAEVESQ